MVHLDFEQILISFSKVKQTEFVHEIEKLNYMELAQYLPKLYSYNLGWSYERFLIMISTFNFNNIPNKLSFLCVLSSNFTYLLRLCYYYLQITGR